MVYKSLNGLAPAYMLNLLKPRVKPHYAVRSLEGGVLHTPKSRTETYKKSFSFSGAKLWNTLPACIKESETLVAFKRQCYKFIDERWQNEVAS